MRMSGWVWEQIGKLLDGWEDEQVNLRGVRVERVRQFGKVYVALALWRRLGLHRFFEKHLAPGRESVGWEQVASILALGERWYA